MGALLISASLVFVGYKANSGAVDTSVLDEKIASFENSIDNKVQKGIEKYIQKQQDQAVKQQQWQAKQQAQAAVDIDIDNDAILGDPDAPVTLIEFSDYECPFCKKYYTQTYPDIKKNYVDKGLVRIVFRDFPLGFHDPIATQEAMAAECAREQEGDEMYYEYHDLIFDTTKSNKGLQKSQLYELASQLDLNEDDFKECLDTEKYKQEVQKDMADGQKYGVSGTPGFFINGRIIKWAQPYVVFERIIEEELKKVGE